MRRASAGLVAAGLALAAGAPALAQPRTPLQELLEYKPPRPIAPPRVDEYLFDRPSLPPRDLPEPGLGGPVAPPAPLSTSIIGTVRASDPVSRGPVARIRELFPALRACWKPPGGRPRGLETTIRLAFRRDGTVLGEPRVTYQKAGPDEDRQAFRRSVVLAVEACTPLAFRSSFGQAIAGRPVAIRFIDDRTP